MRDQISSRFASLQRAFTSFTAGQKVIAVIGGLALVLGAVMVFRWASTPTYAPLFTNMDPADASAVVDQLNADGTPYELTDGGTSVMVPEKAVYDARIKLSGEGLPSSSSDGYGLLDKQSLSTSKFGETTGFKRAMEGELRKTIEALDPVQSAVVLLSMPEEKLFETEDKAKTASVMVRTRAGDELDSEQVQAIVNLVSSAVEGLDPKNVSLTDASGKVLTSAGDGVDAFGNSRDEQVVAFEKRTGDSITAMLDKIVGPGNSSVKVTANLDFDKSITQTTQYFREPGVGALSESTESEEYNGTGAGGVTGGAVGPDGQMTTQPGGEGSAYNKKRSTRDNALGKTVENREAAPGSVSGIDAAVIVDTQSLGGNTPDQLRAAIAAALGIDAKRGDTLEVTAMPFNTAAEEAAQKALAAAEKAEAKDALMANIKTGGIILAVAMAALIAWLKGRKRRKLRDQATTYVVEQLRRQAEPVVVAAPAATPELPPVDSSHQLRAAARDEIAAMVERQPEEVAQLLRGWLVEADR